MATKESVTAAAAVQGRTPHASNGILLLLLLLPTTPHPSGVVAVAPAPAPAPAASVIPALPAPLRMAPEAAVLISSNGGTLAGQGPTHTTQEMPIRTTTATAPLCRQRPPLCRQRRMELELRAASAPEEEEAEAEEEEEEEEEETTMVGATPWSCAHRKWS